MDGQNIQNTFNTQHNSVDAMLTTPLTKAELMGALTSAEAMLSEGRVFEAIDAVRQVVASVGDCPDRFRAAHDAHMHVVDTCNEALNELALKVRDAEARGADAEDARRGQDAARQQVAEGALAREAIASDLQACREAGRGANAAVASLQQQVSALQASLEAASAQRAAEQLQGTPDARVAEAQMKYLRAVGNDLREGVRQLQAGGGTRPASLRAENLRWAFEALEGTRHALRAARRARKRARAPGGARR